MQIKTLVSAYDSTAASPLNAQLAKRQMRLTELLSDGFALLTSVVLADGTIIDTLARPAAG